MTRCTPSSSSLGWWTSLAHLSPNFLSFRSYIDIPLDPHWAVLPQIEDQVTLQRICVTSHIALYAATGTWGGSLESGTTVHSAPETFAQIVKSSRTTTALTLSSCSRLRLIGRHSKETRIVFHRSCTTTFIIRNTSNNHAVRVSFHFALLCFAVPLLCVKVVVLCAL